MKEKNRKFFPEQKIAIVTARFNEAYTRGMTKAAVETLEKYGLRKSQVHCIDVAGSFEIPLAAVWAIEHLNVQGVIAVGVLIKGETNHYEMISESVVQALMNVQLQYQVPVANAVLNCTTEKQAEKRSRANKHNKGIEAAQAVFEMIELRKKFAELGS